MKKTLSILFAVLMLVLVFASCGGNDVTTTEVPTTEAPTTEAPTTEAPTTEAPTTEAPTTEAPTTEAPTTEAPTTEAPTTEAPNLAWSSKTDIRNTWSGKTLNIACSTWSANPSAPWSVMELCVKEGEESGFGVKIDTAVLERQKFIKDTYGVELNWIQATRYKMQDALEVAQLADNIIYDLALPRALNAQALVSLGYIYDLAGRDFIDFNNSYYNDASVKAYTAKGHTFFVTGGFSNMDYDIAIVLYFNKALLGDGSEKAVSDFYQIIRDGKWTYGKLIEYASAAYSDDGDGKADDEDTYGLYMATFDGYFQHFGINKVSVNQSTGEWELTINDDRADDVISAIITTQNAEWRTGQYYDLGQGPRFTGNKLLFVYDAVQYTSVLSRGDIDFGIAPFPMHNEEQGRYYVTVSNQQSVLMCIPKATQDREMAEYMLDVLAWTGEEYVQKVYFDTKEAELRTDADREMLTEYIFPNLSYDPSRYTGFNEVIDVDLAWLNKNYTFEKVYNEKSPDALNIIADWNAAWGGYTEE